MNKTRMLELADVLDTTPRHKFDMGSWAKRFKLRGTRRYSIEEVPENGSLLTALKDLPKTCNTSACIAGWAVALHPRAGQTGLYTKPQDDHDFYSVDRHARLILGLTGDDAQRLFFTHMRLTPQQAAARIRKSVELGYVPA